MSQPEVARALGCTRGYVSIIERAALRKLRRALERIGVDAPASSRAVNWWGEGGEADAE